MYSSTNCGENAREHLSIVYNSDIDVAQTEYQFDTTWSAI
jgi:hypothetical protein